MKLLGFPEGELTRKLQTYLTADPQYKAVYDYTRQRFDASTNLVAHNWEHAFRDTLNAIVIGEAEGADMRIVLPAITMHDIGFLYGATGKTHGAVGADKLPEFLSDGNIAYPDEEIVKIAGCIRTHKGSMHNEKPESLEAKVVADADLLEKFGPFGVYSGLRTYAEFNYPIEHIIDKESSQQLTLETPTGQRLAEPGRKFVADFYRELKEANEPYEGEKLV